MTILDIGGGFNGTETQLELVSVGVWFFILTCRTHVRYHLERNINIFDNQNPSLMASYFCFSPCIILTKNWIISFCKFLQHYFWQVNNAVMDMVDLYFPSTGVSVIAEPGSFFVSSAFSFAVNIISKEVVARDCQDLAHGELH